MRKIFFNALSYDDGGWFICEIHDYPYKNKTKKPLLVTIDGVGTVNKDPEVQAYFSEISEVRKQLEQEMLKVALDLGLVIFNWDDKPYKEGEKIECILLDNDDGKKLSDALIVLGWKKQFIAIGP